MASAPTTTGSKIKGDWFPNLGFVLTMPEELVFKGRMKRLHDVSAREAMRRTLEYYHANRLKEHFKVTAKKVFDHKKRAFKTHLLKILYWNQGKDPEKDRTAAERAQKHLLTGSTVDLVKKGDRAPNSLKNTLLRRRPPVTVSGTDISQPARRGSSGMSGGLRGRLTFRWPFPVSRSAKGGNRGVTPADMKKELEQFSEEDRRILRNVFAGRYRMGMIAALKQRPKLRKKYGSLFSKAL